MSAAKKKSKHQPVSAMKRSVTFDGRGILRCERCGTREELVPAVYPDMPREQYAWEQKFNVKVEGFLERHRGCE